jgi:hypothetical protein
MKKGKRKRFSEIWKSKVWDEVFKNPVTKNYRISFCTTCMDRLQNLKETLPKNIEDNKNYNNLEFVLLDYNSSDGLEEWVKNNMMEHINSGRLVFYRTTEPKYFDMSHSRNIAFKVATGEIVNNLDADNYTFNDDIKSQIKNVSRGEKIHNHEFCWAEYINKIANECQEKVLFAKGKQLRHGRIGFFKKEFLELGGYDESLEGYGYDDEDLVHRSSKLGFTLYKWGGSYIKRIHTSQKEKNQHLKVKHDKTQGINTIISENNIKNGIFVANQGKHWGKAKLIKNFKEEIEV